MSRISIEKLASVACEYKLGDLARWPKSDERPYLPPTSFMALSEAIKAGVFLPLHPFIDEVQQFFNMVLFWLTPNFYRIIVTFCIAFMEACRFEPLVDHFAYMFRVKAITRHMEFWYTTG